MIEKEEAKASKKRNWKENRPIIFMEDSEAPTDLSKWCKDMEERKFIRYDRERGLYSYRHRQEALFWT